ncbi:MAG: OmpA family protein [Alphaproteobacteria bacterium]|nr:OmpA family protein [Alphaproteobacteria bacterium]
MTTPPKETIVTPFQMALADGYQRFANVKKDDSHLLDSYHFAQKSRQAREGYNVAPEDPKNWSLNPDDTQQLTVARSELIKITTENLTQQKPKDAAILQIAFDCWLEELEKNPEGDNTSKCQTQFYKSLRAIKKWDKEQVIAQLPENLPESEPGTPAVPFKTSIEAPQSQPQETKTDQNGIIYSVYFDHGTGIPSASVKKRIKAISRDIVSRGLQNQAIILSGYTDHTGPSDFNQFIAEKRAKAIKSLLINENIPAANISLFAFGDSQAKMTTQDEAQEAKNRRVDILIGQ